MKVAILLSIACVISATYAQGTFDIDPLMIKEDSLEKKLDSVAMNVDTMKEQVDQVHLLLETQAKKMNGLEQMLEKVLKNTATMWRTLTTGSYVFLGEPLTWHEARDKCKELGGYLVEINSKGENDLLRSTVIDMGWQDLKLDFWLGLNDIEEAGTWVWDHSQKGVNEGYSKMGHNGSSHCAQGKSSYSVGRWEKAPCDRKTKLDRWERLTGAVCERGD
eukprot:GFUD01057247.1.p1 GENE.GFUD01057247.1~~GFUD01057247.1.p1  ORF type:complete len:219 (+),score=43.29 GFUD01057247.1:62-718(+)